MYLVIELQVPPSTPNQKAGHYLRLSQLLYPHAVTKSQTFISLPSLKCLRSEYPQLFRVSLTSLAWLTGVFMIWPLLLCFPATINFLQVSCKPDAPGFAPSLEYQGLSTWSHLKAPFHTFLHWAPYHLKARWEAISDAPSLEILPLGSHQTRFRTLNLMPLLLPLIYRLWVQTSFDFKSARYNSRWSVMGIHTHLCNEPKNE